MNDPKHITIDATGIFPGIDAHRIHNTNAGTGHTFRSGEQSVATLYVKSSNSANERAKDIVLLRKQPNVTRVKVVHGHTTLVKVEYRRNQFADEVTLNFSIWDAIDVLVSSLCNDA